MTTAVVVPSPTSASCVFAISTIIFAAGWSMSSSFRIVTPSFVMVMSPIPSMSILSIPLGPSVERTAAATACAPAKLLFWASSPRFRVAPSLRMIMGCPPSCCDILVNPRNRIFHLSPFHRHRLFIRPCQPAVAGLGWYGCAYRRLRRYAGSGAVKQKSSPLPGGRWWTSSPDDKQDYHPSVLCVSPDRVSVF